MKNLCLAALVVVFVVDRAWSVVIVDDFNDGNNVGWTDGSPLAGFGATTTYSYPGGNTYRIQIGASPSPTTLGPSRGGSYRSDANYTQFAAKIDLLNWTLGGGTSMIAGLLARVNNIGLGTTNGYSISYSTAGIAYLSRITAEVPTTLVSTPVSLTSGTGYQFSFTGNGADLLGEIYALSNLTTPLVSLSYSDATYSSGVTALLVYDSSSAATANHTPSATFDNYVSSETLVRGDYNYDGHVDAADYVVWRNNVGNTLAPSNYDVWRAHFGESINPAAGAGFAAAVPEPSVLPLPAIGLLSVVGRFRRKCSRHAPCVVTAAESA